MNLDLGQLNEQQEDQPDENKDLKIKLLDDLIEKIMSLPDEGSPAEEKLESPQEEAQEDSAMQPGQIEDKLKGLKI